MIPSAAVFAAAIEDAEGFPITAMPISPSELFAPRGRRTHAEGDRMKITGDATSCTHPVEKVWDALLDPAVLVAHHPGLRAARGDRRERLRDDRHRRRRRDQGHLRRDVRAVRPAAEHESLVMKLQGAGAPGTIGADRRRRASPTAATAPRTVTYDADAVVGGMVGGVGQRMLELGLASGWPASSSATSTASLAGRGRRWPRPPLAAAGAGGRCRHRRGRRQVSSSAPPKAAAASARAATTSSRASPSAPGWCSLGVVVGVGLLRPASALIGR